MKRIIIKKVTTNKEKKQFVNFPLKLFKDTPNFVPPMYSDEMKILNQKSSYSLECDSVFFLAYIDKKVVGRISGIIHHTYNKIHNEKQARFTRFDSIDDIDVAKALFDAVITWAKNKGADHIVGPLDYSDLEREGLLIQGFDERMTFEEQYHPSYYQKLIEQLGFEKDVDWYEFELTFEDGQREKLEKVSKFIEKTTKVTLAPLLPKKQYIKKYMYQVFDMIDICYGKLYGTMPLSDKTKKQIVKQFGTLIIPKYLPVAINEKGEMVGFGLSFPAIGHALKKSGGRLTIPALFKLLNAINHPEVLELCLVAIHPDYQNKGINALFLTHMYKNAKQSGIKCCETNLNLETNHEVMAQWKNFNARNHKIRRCYKKQIDLL